MDRRWAGRRDLTAGRAIQSVTARLETRGNHVHVVLGFVTDTDLTEQDLTRSRMPAELRAAIGAVERGYEIPNPRAA